MEKNISNLIDRLGGESTVATHLGLTRQAVHKWTRVGYIPAKWYDKIVALASLSGIPLSAADIIGLPEDGISRDAALDLALDQARAALEGVNEALNKLRAIL